MTSTTREWRAKAAYPRTEPLTDEQRETLVLALDGFGILREDGAQLHVEWTITAPTIRTATDVALRALRQTWVKTFGEQRDPTQFRILTIEEHVREIARPYPQDLVGWTEIAEMLHVSPQRAQQLAALEAFPPPVVHLASGPVFTRASVVEFGSGWVRKPGRPRKAG